MPSKTIQFLLLLTTITKITHGQDEEAADTRMLGGLEVRIGEHECMASIIEFNEGKWERTCLGTVIATRWILTSGSCVVGVKMENTVVDVGNHFLGETGSQGTRKTICGITVHPDYNSLTGFNDIAVIKLNEPIVYNAYVQEIPLGTVKDENGIKVVPIGWDARVTNSSELGKSVYSAVKLYTVETNTCQEIVSQQFPKVVVYGDTEICAYAQRKGVDMCVGDEGGPLVAYSQQTESLRQVGIFTSILRDIECKDNLDHPLIFTRIEPYVDWINNVTGLTLTLD